MTSLDMEGRYRGSVRHDDHAHGDPRSKAYTSLTPRAVSNAQPDWDTANGWIEGFEGQFSHSGSGKRWQKRL